MTVSEAFGAHASAQMANARVADQSRRVSSVPDRARLPQESRSFVETWAIRTTVIGVARAS
jgi:hypothetical protein